MMRRVSGVPPVSFLLSSPWPMPGRATGLVVLGCVVALGLAGCGRKGPLEPPPGAVNAKENPLEEKEEVDANAPKPLIPAIQPVGSKKAKKIQAPKQPFILDPLL
jgi:predicted small lipoprotein YifL